MSQFETTSRYSPRSIAARTRGPKSLSLPIDAVLCMGVLSINTLWGKWDLTQFGCRCAHNSPASHILSHEYLMDFPLSASSGARKMLRRAL